MSEEKINVDELIAKAAVLRHVLGSEYDKAAQEVNDHHSTPLALGLFILSDEIYYGIRKVSTP